MILGDQMKNKHLEPIAIVGIGAIMPGALNKDEFWNNIKEGKNCITEIPKSYWDYHLFYSPDHKAEDKTYSKIGGFIPETFKFNSIKYRIPPQVAKQMDTVQHLAVETTRMALEDAGYDKKPFDHNRTAVIIGNSMGGMKNEMSNTRLNRPFLYEILKNTETFKHLSPADAQKMMDEMDAGVRERFTPITEDSMPGELANVIPGRVANVFDLHGTNFAVDAACATSLAAIDQAVNGLRMGNFDMAVAGGVDQMMSPSAYIKFCKIGALSETGSYPFDARANGFVMAEGAGMVILKRLSDAVKDGDRIYAVIRAVGASSDGKGKGITAPNPKGQKLAVEKAFEQLDYTPGDVGLLEAHGTGTRVGDATELNALNEIFAPYAKPGSIGLGSVKSQIGHAKAAAGIASLIKTSLALYNKVLPPSINFETPNPIVDWATCPFRVITKTEDWASSKVRRANVSAFGFGGTNFHVAMEEMNDALLKQEEPKVCASAVSPTKQENVNMTSSNSYTLHVPGEKIQGDVLTFSAATKQELFDVLDKAVVAIQYDPAYLPSISYKNHVTKPQKFAVTINVETPEKLKEKIEFFKKIAGTQDVWEQESLYLRMKGIYPFTPTEMKPKVCFMFPGQGSQYVDMMKDLASKYKVVQDTFDEADRLLTNIIGQTLTETLWSKPGETKEQIAVREAAIKKTEMTQPAVLTADIAMMRLLSSFGIKPDVVMGHSLGEYAAAVAAGIFDFENGLKAVCTRGKVMSEIKVEDNGKMASIAAPVERVEPELARINGYVAVANKNCPTQTVIAGASKSIDDAIKMFTDMGIQAVQIPVSHAFHSAIVRPAMPQYRAFLDTLTFHAPTMPITTNVTAEFYPSDPEKIKDLMVTQISHSVEWIKQLKTTYDSGVRLFVECGPKRVLSALASSTLSDKKDIKVLASNHPKKGGICEFNDLFANLISSGIALNWKGTDMYGDHSTYNPAFVNWVTGTATPVEKEMGASCSCQAAPAQADGKTCCDKDIVISGIAAGGPGSWDRIFRDGVLDEILSGRNLIEPVSAEIQQKQIDKHVEFVIKSKDGNHRFERLTSPSQAIKLAAKGGAFDAEKEFGLPAKWVRSMDRSFQLAIAAGILALKDAGIPLVLYYKPTSTGGYLPDRWGLPADMIDDTGVIFTSAFPVANSMMGDLSKRVAGLLSNKTAKEVRAFCDKFISQIADPALKAEIEAWYNENFKDKEVEPQAFTSEFILKTIIIAHSHFCQWIRARGPATAMSAACASTAQAIAVATDWIKLGRAKRVIVISADDITNDNVSEWILTAFLASGAATTEADVTKAALPFDRRRNGMIVGMGAVSLVVEDAQEVAKRGMKPLAKVLATEIRNSGFHVTRLDVAHVAQVMNDLVTEAERKSGVSRSDIAKQLVFISHETYTPARGGSASAEAYALKSTFGKDVSSVIVSNTKGFTGHSMGAGLEDAIAVHCLNTGLVPPIANFKEADPELEGITLSKGGHYNFKYALRLAAGFGSQIGMTLLEKVWDVKEPRIVDAARHEAWLKEISGQQTPVLEVVQNTLRVKDNYKHGVKPSLVMEGSQAFVDKVNAIHHTAPAAQAAAPAAQPAAVTPAPAAQPAPVAASKPMPSLKEEDVQANILNIISEKTGYPQDMLDLDLDMEADLGIDTVKQAELFAIMRETYHIARQEGVQLKDYPTIRSIIKYAIANAGSEGSAAPAAQAAAPAAQPAAVTPAPVAQPAAASKPMPSLNEADVQANILNIISEKTGYPQDMLDLDLDMEADLGIDTVKQAELFAIMRETYHIARQEGVQLKDYPTIRSIIKYAIANAGSESSSAPAPVQAVPAVAPVAQAAAPVAQPAAVAAPAAQPAAASKPMPSLNEADVQANILNIISEKTGYPQDMLDLDLDMEADLGIDTVKQAELFAIMRETYHIARQEGVQLKDYPTIRSIIKYAIANASSEGSAAPAAQAAAPAAQPAAPVAQPAAVTPAPAAVAPSVAAPAAQPAAASKPMPSLNEADVQANILNIIAEKTGYPQDMLDLDLDMEADLGIDTVKQAELFAIMRETYHIARQEGVQLKDYPTIRSIIKYALANAGTEGTATAAPTAQAAAPAAQPAAPVAQPAAVTPAPAAQPAPAAAPAAPAKPAAGKLDPAQVSEEIVSMVAEKTGYPKDMLDLDLDMEADLGIDTVKQAELFAAMREHYGIAQQEGIQLKDYPTIRHCINFVLNAVNNPSAPAAQAAAAAQPAPAAAPAAQPAAPVAQPAPAAAPAAPAKPAVVKPAVVTRPTAEHIGKPAEDALTTNPTAPIVRHESLAERPEAPGYKGEHCHEKKLRYVTMVADAPLTERENRRLAKDRTVLIFADNSQLIKAYQEEFKELGVKTHVFTTLKTRSKNTTIVNWESYEETEAALKEYAAEDPNIQGIVYLLGASVKKFDKKASPHNELTKYVMPLFIALRVFEKGLSNHQDADTFFVVNTKIDGNFGYSTKDEFNPIVGALTGGTTCYRKDVYERTGAISKLIDFETDATPDDMAQITMDEVLHGDMRLMIGTKDKVRSTILSVPMQLDRSVKHFDLTGKTVIFTGSGRGIGAMLAQKLAAQYHSKIIVLDIIEIQEKTPLWATMNESELAALKKQMWEEMRADHTKKATPVMLERAFGRVKDSVTLYNNLQKLRELGSEVEYYHCDVTNSSMVKEVCTKIKAKNGRVDGIIHFAGLERSKLIYDKDPMEYYRIFDVKATSFASFLANNVVKDKGFFAFASSIAGKYGNLGQSDYASANDYLAKSALSLSNQGYRAISIAMSAYKNVGMGVRAGVETFLRSNGVDFVDPEDGMQIFLDEIVYGRVPEIVLTGSLGRLDWDHQLLFEMDEIGAEQKLGSDDSDNNNTPQGGQTPSGSASAQPAGKATHFLGEVKQLQAGKEFHGEKEFNLKSDPYLSDHAIEGTPYVPGVMGIETFMETATALTGNVPQGLEDVHFFLPIKLLRNRPQAVRVIGTSDGTGASMEIESDFINSKGVKMGNTRRHFTAKTLSSFTSTWDEVKNDIHLDVNAAPVVTKEEIYKKYFHGPSFQVLGGILRVNEKESLAVYNTTPKPQWPEPKTLLANPMLIEAAFQCCGFQDMSVANKMTLPDGIKAVAVFKREVPPQKLYLYGVNKGLTADGKTLHDAYVFDEQGNVWVEIHGYQAIGQ